MTDLVIRKIGWEFDASVPFLWQPTNPNFSNFCNAFTFIAVPFEKYIISAVRKAQAEFDKDPVIAAEAQAFLRQEAQHAAAHRKHMLALVERYPALEKCYEDAVNAYDELIEQHPAEFHWAYIANLEATFTPLFKLVLDNRDALFGNGDQRVASLMMWHFVEEIEHRSSGTLAVSVPARRSLVPRQAHSEHLQTRRRPLGHDREDVRRGRPLRGTRGVGRRVDVDKAADRRVSIPRARRCAQAGQERRCSAHPVQCRPDKGIGFDGVEAAALASAVPRSGRPTAAAECGHLDAGVRPGHRHDDLLRKAGN